MGLFKWMGRVMLWAVAWPVGLWRSMRHGSKKDAKRIVRMMKEQ